MVPSDWVFGVPHAGIKTETHVTREAVTSSSEAYDGAWVTLLTKQTYLPGLIILYESLRQVKSAFPLIVLYTTSLEAEALQVLKKLQIRHELCEYIHPIADTIHIADRFVDTWTKLRICELSHDRVVMIDNDMIVLQNMDELFYMPLKQGQIAATHGCICNLDDSSWAPKWFTKDNCPYTGQTHPTALTHPAKTGAKEPIWYKQLNSGLVVLRPDPNMKDKIEAFLANPPKGQTFQFPDQDVLVALYGDDWKSLAWTYNAVKISRDWHADMWNDQSVKNLHYICDKPWEARPKEQNDLYCHDAWWNAWDSWMAEQKDQDTKKYLSTLVAA